MRWGPIAVLIILSPAFAVYSGTFVENFSDRELDGWLVRGFPNPVFPDRVRVKDDYLVMDAAPADPLHFLRANARMEVSTGDWKNWDSYTLTCQIRFDEFAPRKSGEFHVLVRKGEGRFGVVAVHYMLIEPEDQRIHVYTIPPDAEAKLGQVKGRIHRHTLERQQLRRPIKRNKWVSIEIVAEKSFFEFHYDGILVTRYEDKTAQPGTVGFWTYSGLVVHLDDVIISGEGVSRSVNHDAHLATTWGEVKNPSWK